MAWYTIYFKRTDRSVADFVFSEHATLDDALTVASSLVGEHPDKRVHCAEVFDGTAVIGCAYRETTRVSRALGAMSRPRAAARPAAQS